MSREIKFRAYHKVQKKMFHVMTMRDLCTSKMFMDLKFDDIIIEQYTGLKDKNGKEIYEGDIYKTMDVVGYNNDDEPQYRSNYHIVEYGEGVCAVGFQFLTHHFNIKVIGNIHENPELLT